MAERMHTPERRVENAKIISTFLGIEDHGCFTAFIAVEGAFGGQSFGGYVLKGPYAALFIQRALEVVGVYSWEKLIGRHVRIDHESTKIHRLGNIIEDKWFHPSAEFKALRGEGDDE